MGRHYASGKREKRNDRIFVSGPDDCFLAVKRDGTVVRVGKELYLDSEYGFAEEISGWKDIVSLACADKCLLGLTKNGTVECAHINWSCGGVKEWENIVDVDLGYNFAVGLTADGHVVTTGRRYEGEEPLKDFAGITVVAGICYDGVDSWSDIAAVTACRHIVGLKRDGTVVAEGENGCGQCDVSDWRDIVAVACGRFHTVGLKSDGTVIAAGGVPEAADGGRGKGICDVSEWTDIVDIAADDDFTIGLRADGTVVTAGKCLDLSGWRDIAAVNVSNGKIFGIRRDGRVAGFEDEEGWQDIVAVRYGWRAMVGLRKDGTAAGKVLVSDSPGVKYIYSDEGKNTNTIPQDLESPWTRWKDIAVEPDER